MEGLYHLFKQIFHAGDVAVGKVKHGAQAVTNNLVNLVFFNKLLLQDEQCINKNIEEIAKLGGESFHEILYAFVDELLYDRLILPILKNPSPMGEDIKDFGWIGGAVDNNREQIVKTIVSILETILRRLATESATTTINNEFSTTEKKEINLSPEPSLSVVDFKDSSVNVSMNPSKFGVSIIAQLLRIVKEIAHQDKYIPLLQGESDGKLENEFLEEVIETILEKAFPDKTSDKELPYLIRNILHYFIGWDNLVKILSEKLHPLLPCHQKLMKHEPINKDQEIFIDMIVDPVVQALQNLGKDKKTLVNIDGLGEKPNKFIDGTVKALLGGNVLKKDQPIVKETVEHVKLMMKNFLANLLIDLGGGDPVEGISKMMASAAEKVKIALASINEENKEQTLMEITKVLIGDLLKEPTVYEKALLPQLTKLVTELYEVLKTAQEKGSQDKQLLQQVQADSFLEDILIKNINKYLEEASFDTNKPLIEGNPILDGVIKNLLKKNGTKETTVTSFLKMYIEIGLNRVMANLLRGQSNNPMDNLKGRLDKVLEKLNHYSAEINDNNVEEKITELTRELLDEVATDEQLKEFIPPMLKDSLDIKKLLLPKLASIVKEVYQQKQKIDTLQQQDEKILQGDGIKVSPEILKGVNALRGKINEELHKALNDIEVDAKEEKFLLIKDDKFLNEIAKHFFTSPEGKNVREVIKDVVPKIVTRLLANILKNGEKDYAAFIQSKVSAILKQFPQLDFDQEKEPFQKMMDMLELSQVKPSINAKRLRDFSYDKKLSFEERLLSVEKMKEGDAKQEALKELYQKLMANKIALQVIDEVITDEEVKALLPPTFQNLDGRRMIASALSPYVSDIVQNIKGLEAIEKKDAQIIGQYLGLQGICDDYVKWMMDDKIVKQIKKGIMPVDNEQASNPMAPLVNWLAQILVIDPNSSENKEFLETHLKRVLNHTLASLLENTNPWNTPQERISSLMSRLTHKSTQLVNELKTEYSKKFNQEEFENLLEKHKEIIGEVNIQDLEPKLKKELWKKLLSIDPVDKFLKEILPDSLLQEIMPKFVVEGIRRMIVGQMAEAMVKNRKLLTPKGLYHLVLDTLKKTTGKNVSTVREGLKKVVSSSITKAIGGILSKFFGDKAGKVIHWALYIVFFPFVVVGQWLLMTIVDQMFLKKADAFLKDHDIENILEKLVSKIPSLLNAIYSNPPNRNVAIQRAQELLDELREIITSKFLRKKAAEMLVSFLSPPDNDQQPKQEFFSWLAPKINPTTLFAT